MNQIFRSIFAKGLLLSVAVVMMTACSNNDQTSPTVGATHPIKNLKPGRSLRSSRDWL
ncbi:MAG: hypothetical protein MUO77_17795 [Anaerolineales bacterium]|nr:hypothetical protein [Anaerolineales bacterium]